MDVRGSFVALVTPFDRKGRLDTKALEKLVEWHVVEGTDGIVCSATTGEGPCLSAAERKKLAQICIQTAAQRIPVIVSTGTNDTKTTIKYTEQAKKLGADACLVVTPYYNKPSQRGCFLHVQEVAKVGLPLIIYHIPHRTAVRLTPETILQMAQIPHVVGIKESSGDLELVAKISKLIPVLSGDDDLTYKIMKAGGTGTIGVIGNVVPRAWKQLIQLCLEKKWEEAERLSQKYLPLIKSLFLETNPQCVKFALSWLGKCHPVLRMPMLLPTEATQWQIKKQILALALPHFRISDRAIL